MQKFICRAIDDFGKKEDAVMEAENKAEAIAKLEEGGLTVLSIKKISTKIGKSGGGRIHLNTADKIGFFVHLAEMARAGMSTKHTLSLLLDLSENRRLKKLALNMVKRVDEGLNVSEAMSEAGCFGEIFPNLIYVAERTNSVEKVSTMIIDYIKWTGDIRRQIVSAIVKPIISLCFVMGIMVAVSIFALPRLKDTLSQLSGGVTPLKTQQFMDFMTGVRNNWYIVPIVISALVFLNYIPRALKLERVSVIYDKIKLKIPLFGSLLLKIEMARLSSFLAILIHSGYKANDAITMCPKVVVNRYIRKSAVNVSDIMVAGSTILNAFSSQKVFPKFFLSMIGIGEEVNQIERTVMNIKEIYDKEVKSSAEFVISSVKPMITIFMGSLIGWMAVAIFSPIYTSISAISKT
jgi:type II secretory pathway component PulF